MAASLTEGDREAAVVEPPDGFAAPSFELPILSMTSFTAVPTLSDDGASVSRVPVPRSGCQPPLPPRRRGLR